MKLTTEDGTIRVFKSKFGDNRFYIGLSKKLEDGTYDNHYVNIRFKNDNIPEITDFKDIVITNAFLTYDKYDVDGETRKSLVIQVLDYEVK